MRRAPCSSRLKSDFKRETEVHIICELPVSCIFVLAVLVISIEFYAFIKTIAVTRQILAERNVFLSHVYFSFGEACIHNINNMGGNV